MNTIRELKQQEKYKNMLKRKNKEKNIYKTRNETLKIKYEGIKKVLEKKDKEIERLNNIINKYVEDMEDYLESNPPVDMQDYTYRVSDIEFLEKGIEELKFITTIREKLKELKGEK